MSVHSDSAVSTCSASFAAQKCRLSIKQSNQLQKQSSRWLNLSRTLWALIVKDSSYTVADENDGSLSSFFDVIEWKIQGKVSVEEFTFLYSEWMKQADSRNQTDIINSNKNGMAPNVQIVRQILLDRSSTEKDLTRFIGIILHENNLNLIDIPISYTLREYHLRNHSNLELCNESWLTLCESLFFALDVLGQGYLQFDEIFFFCSCLVIGTFSSDSVSSETIPDLELTVLTGMAMQLMVDCNSGDVDGVLSSENILSSSTRPSAVSMPSFKQHLLSKGIGVTALEALLQNVRLCVRVLTRILYTEGDVDILQSCLSVPLSKRQELSVAAHNTEKRAHSGMDKNQGNDKGNVKEVTVESSAPPSARDLGSPSSSASPGRAGGGISGAMVRVTGPPRLWQRAVKLAAGYDEVSYDNAPTSPGNVLENVPMIARKNRISGRKAPPPPPIVLFLLSDAEELLRGTVRALPLSLNPGLCNPTRQPVNGTMDPEKPESVRTTTPQPHLDFGPSNSTVSPGPYAFDFRLESNVIDETVHYAVFELWLHFQYWGLNGHKGRKQIFSLRNKDAPDTSSISCEDKEEQKKEENNEDSNTVSSSLQESRSKFSHTKPVASDDKDRDKYLHMRARKDPIYLVILAALLEYKAFQVRLAPTLISVACHMVRRTLLSSVMLDYPSSSSVRVASTALLVNGRAQIEGLASGTARLVSDFEALYVSVTAEYAEEVRAPVQAPSDHASCADSSASVSASLGPSQDVGTHPNIADTDTDTDTGHTGHNTVTNGFKVEHTSSYRIDDNPDGYGYGRDTGHSSASYLDVLSGDINHSDPARQTPTPICAPNTVPVPIYLSMPVSVPAPIDIAPQLPRSEMGSVPVGTLGPLELGPAKPSKPIPVPSLPNSTTLIAGPASFEETEGKRHGKGEEQSWGRRGVEVGPPPVVSATSQRITGRPIATTQPSEHKYQHQQEHQEGEAKEEGSGTGSNTGRDMARLREGEKERERKDPPAVLGVSSPDQALVDHARSDSKYTETLFEILKQMPTEQSSKDHLKSLQKVLKLGYDIAQKEHSLKLRLAEEEKEIEEEQVVQSVESAPDYVNSAFKKNLDYQLVDIYGGLDGSSDNQMHFNDMHRSRNWSNNVGRNKSRSNSSSPVKASRNSENDDDYHEDDCQKGHYGGEGSYENEREEGKEKAKVRDGDYGQDVHSGRQQGCNEAKIYHRSENKKNNNQNKDYQYELKAIVNKESNKIQTGGQRTFLDSVDNDSESDFDYPEPQQASAHHSSRQPYLSVAHTADRKEWNRNRNNNLYGGSAAGGGGGETAPTPTRFSRSSSFDRGHPSNSHTPTPNPRLSDTQTQPYFVRTCSRDSLSTTRSGGGGVSGGRNQNPPSVISDLDDITVRSMSPFLGTGGRRPLWAESPSYGPGSGSGTKRGVSQEGGSGHQSQGRTFFGEQPHAEHSRNSSGSPMKLTKTQSNLMAVFPAKVPGTIPSEHRKSSKKRRPQQTSSHVSQMCREPSDYLETLIDRKPRWIRTVDKER